MCVFVQKNASSTLFVWVVNTSGVDVPEVDVMVHIHQWSRITQLC